MQVRYQSGQGTAEVNLERQGDGWLAVIDGITHEVEVLDRQRVCSACASTANR